MAKIIKFPTGEEIDPKDLGIEKTAEDIITERSKECVAVSQELLDIIEEFVCTGQVSDFKEFMSMNFREEACYESRDIYVIVNMINAMLNRYMGIPHRLQRELDKTYITLKMLPLGEPEE